MKDVINVCRHHCDLHRLRRPCCHLRYEWHHRSYHHRQSYQKKNCGLSWWLVYRYESAALACGLVVAAEAAYEWVVAVEPVYEWVAEPEYEPAAAYGLAAELGYVPA